MRILEVLIHCANDSLNCRVGGPRANLQSSMNVDYNYYNYSIISFILLGFHFRSYHINECSIITDTTTIPNSTISFTLSDFQFMSYHLNLQSAYIWPRPIIRARSHYLVSSSIKHEEGITIKVCI
jgi:hypothetical protein